MCIFQLITAPWQLTVDVRLMGRGEQQPHHHHEHQCTLTRSLHGRVVCILARLEMLHTSVACLHLLWNVLWWLREDGRVAHYRIRLLVMWLSCAQQVTAFSFPNSCSEQRVQSFLICFKQEQITTLHPNTKLVEWNPHHWPVLKWKLHLIGLVRWTVRARQHN